MEALSGGVVTGKESAEPTSPRTSKRVGGMEWGRGGVGSSVMERWF